MSGFTDDGYEARTAEEIFEDYLSSVDSEYGDDLEPYEGSFVQALFEGLSNATADNQEQDLEELYYSLFVETATGEHLTKLVRGFGVQRRPAIGATGVVQWSRNNVGSDVTIPIGVPVTTQRPDPVEFETTESVTINGPENPSDTSTYTTTSTSFTEKVTHTIETIGRDSIEVSAEYNTQNSSYTSYIEIVDATNSNTIDSDNTTSTSSVSVGPTTYDTSSLTEEIDIEYRIRVENSSGTAEMTQASATLPGQSAERTNVQAIEGGTHGNVGSDRLTRMPSPPPGVNGVTNPWPTGDSDFDLTNGIAQSLGLDREGDEELRDRVLEGASIGGAATVRAVRDKIRALEGTPSLTIYTNRQEVDNANGNGLSKFSSELVIYSRGVTTEEVGEAIFDVVSVTQRFESGVNGTAVTYNKSDNALNQDWVIEWSEPAEINLEITFDIVTEDGYRGEDSVFTAMAEYIGGTLPGGGPVAGLDVGDDVIVDELERRVNELPGIIGTTTMVIDDNGDGNDDTTTRSDGLRAYEVANDEVALVDATSDITVNEV